MFLLSTPWIHTLMEVRPGTILKLECRTAWQEAQWAGSPTAFSVSQPASQGLGYLTREAGDGLFLTMALFNWLGLLAHQLLPLRQ